MQLTATHIHQLSAFMQKIESETYPEVPSEVHSLITESILPDILQSLAIPYKASILDVGCGQGPALDFLTKKGYKPIGITLNDEDVAVCKAKGFEVYKMDQSFLEFPDQTFDFIWARHCIEHSIFPYFTLWQFNRVVKSGGVLYVEVPAPGTLFRHETNPNHYSVLTQGAWESLLIRSGFEILVQQVLPIKLNDGGEDLYFFFVCRKLTELIIA